MPAYNRATLIEASITSALAQRCDDFELLVVDDGSTDATRDVVRQVRDPRLQLIERPHRGVSAALNAGIAAARGTYYARLDSDDVWEPDFLAATLAAIEAPSPADVVYTRARVVGADGQRREADRGVPLLYPDRPLPSMLVRDHASAAALVRLEVLRCIGGFDETLRWWEDWDCWIRLSRVARFRFLDRELAEFRLHAANSSRLGGSAAWRTRTAVLDRAFAALEPLPPDVAAVRGLAYRNAHFDVGLHLTTVPHWGEALHAFGLGIRRSGDPGRATARLVYLLLLHGLGKLSAVRDLHRALSRWRQRRRA
jgi:glycosyltransferase involved in cell wall biosynthesis